MKRYGCANTSQKHSKKFVVALTRFSPVVFINIHIQTLFRMLRRYHLLFYLLLITFHVRIKF